MYRRLRFLVQQGGFDWERGIQAIHRRLYVPQTGTGFRLSRLDIQRIEGSHIERVTTQIVVEGPANEMHRYEKVEYVVVKFVITPANGSLFLFDPPRSIRAFLRDLIPDGSEGPHFGEPQLDVWSWWTNIAARADAAQITKLCFDRIDLSPSIVAEEVLSGIVPTEMATQRVQRRGPRSLAQLGGTLHLGDKPLKIVLGRVGAVRVQEATAASAMELIFAALPGLTGGFQDA